MKLRYVVGRLVSDLVREEPINVGVILQSDENVACKFISKIPKDWGLEEDLVEDVAIKLNEAWSTRLLSPSEIIYLPTVHKHQEIRHTDKFFLEWIQQSYTRHLRFSEIREAEIKITDAFGLETLLLRLFDTFVAPKPRLRKPTMRSKLHTKVKRAFIELELPQNRLRERDFILGSFPWPIDFVYQSNGNGGHEVGIGLVDFASPFFINKAKDLLATWVDVNSMREDAVTRVSVAGGVTGREEHKKALHMLERCSDSLYVFDDKKDKIKLLQRVGTDLLQPGLTNFEKTLRKVSRRVTHPSEPEKEKL